MTDWLTDASALRALTVRHRGIDLFAGFLPKCGSLARGQDIPVLDKAVDSLVCFRWLHERIAAGPETFPAQLALGAF